jgi:hypothetical protein
VLLLDRAARPAHGKWITSRLNHEVGESGVKLVGNDLRHEVMELEL